MRYSAFEARVFSAACEALVAEPVDADRVERFLGDLAARAPQTVRWGFKALLWVVWLAPLLLARSFRSFLSLDEPARVGLWLRALEHRSYSVRQLALVVKAMVCLCHFDLDASPRR